MIQVRSLMKKKVVHVHQNTDLRRIWSFIFKKNIHALPVVDSKNRLLGIVSEEALLEKMYPEYVDFFNDLGKMDTSFLEDRLREMKFKYAKDVMTKLVFTTYAADSLFKALSRMVILHVRQLPVLDKNRRVIGMISKGDIFGYFYSSFVGKKLCLILFLFLAVSFLG